MILGDGDPMEVPNKQTGSSFIHQVLRDFFDRAYKSYDNEKSKHPEPPYCLRLVDSKNAEDLTEPSTSSSISQDSTSVSWAKTRTYDLYQTISSQARLLNDVLISLDRQTVKDSRTCMLLQRNQAVFAHVRVDFASSIAAAAVIKDGAKSFLQLRNQAALDGGVLTGYQDGDAGVTAHNMPGAGSDGLGDLSQLRQRKQDWPGKRNPDDPGNVAVFVTADVPLEVRSIPH